jgi:cyclophilin family peptidyl-prolyl cis-trans isomerase
MTINFYHRVVPNFVVQAGVTEAMDTAARLFDSIRIFAKESMQTGSLGWLQQGRTPKELNGLSPIPPTPHLDGAYSIFGEVSEGMDVLHSLEVGDKILKIDLIK